MRKTELSSPKNPTSYLGPATADLRQLGRGWLLDQQCRNHSRQTLELRTLFLKNLIWFLETHDLPVCGKNELRAFFVYLTNKHPDGRWGIPTLTEGVKQSTVYTYHNHLRTFFNWLVAEEEIPSSPMEKISSPKKANDQIVPFSLDEVEALQKAAKRSHNPLRDFAILVLMLDTGLRASELCSLKISDLDIENKRFLVCGKGNKVRSVPFGRKARKALVQYIRQQRHESDDPLFFADRGAGAGEHLTRSGLYQLFERLGKAAKISTTRCSPHTMRHAFAVNFLINGGNSLTLKDLLGHSDLAMTNRYVNFSQADISNQHQQFSPADGMERRKRRSVTF